MTVNNTPKGIQNYIESIEQDHWVCLNNDLLNDEENTQVFNKLKEIEDIIKQAVKRNEAS